MPKVTSVNIPIRLHKQLETYATAREMKTDTYATFLLESLILRFKRTKKANQENQNSGRPCNLTPKEIRQVKRLRSQGMEIKLIAANFSVSPSTISRLTSQKYIVWKFAPDGKTKVYHLGFNRWTIEREQAIQYGPRDAYLTNPDIKSEPV